MRVERDTALDFIKGLCICLVVYAHLPMDGIWHSRLISWSSFIYSFHIYIFVLITGFLFARQLKHETASIIKVAERMLKPYFIIAPLNMLMYYAAYKFGLKTTSAAPIGIFSGLVDILIGAGGGALWYLYTFGFLQIIFIGVNKIVRLYCREGNLIISSIVSCIVIAWLEIFGLKVNLVCLPFFYYGIIIGFICDKVPRHPVFLVIAPLVYLIPVNELTTTPYHVIWVISILFGLLSVGDNINDSLGHRVFSYLGKHSLSILVLHPFFTTLLRPVAQIILNIDSTGLLLSLIMLVSNVSLCIFSEAAMRKMHIHKLIF